eukprot:4239-Heterococcus_DN1.PRE.2
MLHAAVTATFSPAKRPQLPLALSCFEAQVQRMRNMYMTISAHCCILAGVTAAAASQSSCELSTTMKAVLTEKWLTCSAHVIAVLQQEYLHHILWLKGCEVACVHSFQFTVPTFVHRSAVTASVEHPLQLRDSERALSMHYAAGECAATFDFVRPSSLHA